MEASRFEMVVRNNYYDENFEKMIQVANSVWLPSFGNQYEELECDANIIIIGYNTNDIPVCALIVDTKGNSALISNVGSEPKNIGNGTKIMKFILEKLKETKNTENVCLNIVLDDSQERLEKFYSKFGFGNDINNNMFNFNNKEEKQKYLKL